MIELVKGQELALVDGEDQPLTRLRMGIGWDKNPTSGFLGTGRADVDLDASAFEFAGGELFDLAFFNNLATRDGSVVHRGDNLTGRGDGDDEQIDLDLSRVYQRVDTIVLLVSSYQGHTLEWIAGAYCRLTDDHDVELARFTLTLGVPQTGLAMASLVRDGAGWRLRAIGEGIAATVPTKAITALRPFV